MEYKIKLITFFFTLFMLFMLFIQAQIWNQKVCCIIIARSVYYLTDTTRTVTSIKSSISRWTRDAILERSEIHGIRPELRPLHPRVLQGSCTQGISHAPTLCP